ncbi:MAG: aminotransferase class I/II-fold pyridoxal phosphate-dependent enzyme [Myxococcaceae bacterium]
MQSGLEPSSEEWDIWTRQVLDFIRDLSRSPQGGEGRGEVLIGEQPLSGGFPKILEIFNQGLVDSVSTIDPGFMAYIPGGGIRSAGLANFLGNITNRFTGMQSQAPTLVGLENQVIRWLCHEFNLPETSFGVLTSGGSTANQTAITAARVQVLGDTGDFSKSRLYVSDQVHHSVQKAAFLAGIPRNNCVSIESDGEFRLSVSHFKAQIEEDRKLGFTPFLVVASAGTTNTGAIDPLEELADLCKKEGLWLHVDGAYGGAFMLCPMGKTKLKGIEEADSITMDPHKGLFLPYGTGCLLVKDKSTLLKVHNYEADYLPHSEQDSPASLGPELSREYRGIRLWLPLMLHGAGAFRQALAEKLELTDWLYQELQKLPVKILNKPELSIIVFRPGDISERVNSYGRVYLAPTKLRGELASRVCILSFRTHKAQVQACLEDIRKAL